MRNFYRLCRAAAMGLALAAAIFVVNAASAGVEGPSFDCAKAKKPAEWKSGDQAWLIDLVAPFGGGEEMVNEIKNKIFSDRKMKMARMSNSDPVVFVAEM